MVHPKTFGIKLKDWWSSSLTGRGHVNCSVFGALSIFFRIRGRLKWPLWLANDHAISAAWYDSPYMGIRPRTHWSGSSFIRSWSKPWRCRQGTWRAWVLGRFSRGHHAGSALSTMCLCVYENRVNEKCIPPAQRLAIWCHDSWRPKNHSKRYNKNNNGEERRKWRKKRLIHRLL